MYAPAKDTLYTGGTFKAEWDLYPHDWIEIKAIGGCSSDKVPGIKGVAETGVDFISVGALTHSYKAMDISVKFNK